MILQRTNSESPIDSQRTFNVLPTECKGNKMDNERTLNWISTDPNGFTMDFQPTINGPPVEK